MKKTVKIAFCGMMSALGTAVLLLTYFPYFTYAIPAIVGLISLIVFIETNIKWSFATYIVTAALSLIFAEPEAKLMYILFFGYYPLIKIYIQKIKLRLVQYLLKLSVFNISLLSVYGLFFRILGITFDYDFKYGIYGIIGLLLMANITFILYDIVLVRAAGLYIQRLHPQIKKIFK